MKNTLECPDPNLGKMTKVHVLCSDLEKFQKVRKNFKSDFGLDLTGAGHVYDRDIRETPQIARTRQSEK